MNLSNKIEFNQTRDFGNVLNISFEFIRINAKLIFKSFVYFSLPFITIGVLMGLLSALAIGMPTNFTDIFKSQNSLPSFAFYSLLSTLGSLISGIGILMFSVAIYALMKEYQENDDIKSVSMKNLWNKTTPLFWKYLGASIVISFIVVIGFIFLLIPGIYFAIALSLVLPIAFFEDSGVFNAISRSFNLIKGRWWQTFGLLIILGIIFYSIVMVASIPGIIAMSFSIFPNILDGNITIENFEFSISQITLMYISQFLQNIVSTLASVVIIVGTAFQFFSIRDQKENISLESEIENIGVSVNDMESQETNHDDFMPK